MGRRRSWISRGMDLGAARVLVILFVILGTGCGGTGTGQDAPSPEEAVVETPPPLYIVLTMDAEEKDDLLGIHGGIMDAMLDIFEEEGLEGKVEILMPVDDWRVAVEDNLTVVQRINGSYPVNLHCDRHANLIYQPRGEQERRISSSIGWIKEHFVYSGRVFRAPTLMEGETTRDVLDELGIDYDLTPQIYATPGTPTFYPVLVRENLKMLPTTLIITGGFPDYSLDKTRDTNEHYMKSLDYLYQQAEEGGPVVAVVILHPTNWNSDSLDLLRENIRTMKSRGARFITADEIPWYVPVLGKDPFEFSPRIGVMVDPREDYDPGKPSFNDESFLLYTLRSYGLRAERAEGARLSQYDTILHYSPTGKGPEGYTGRVLIFGKGALSGMTPEALLDPRASECFAPRDLQCALLKGIVDVQGFSRMALEDARTLGETPYLDHALEAGDPCERLRLAYLSREYALQIGSANYPEAERFALVDGKIPQIYYGTVDGVDLGYQPAPHGIAQAAREAFYEYESTGDTGRLERGLFLVDYLLNTSVDRGDYLVWEYPFPWPGYDLEAGWRGSLCQAGILKALMLAYRDTGDERYRVASEKVLHAFSVPVEEGGLLKTRDGYSWYPEYVKDEPPYVLNGFVTTLIWLKEYRDFLGDQEAGALYREGLKGLIAFLPSYDAGGWSYYDALGNKASRHYHKMHVWQMDVMYNQTGEDVFQKYYLRWLNAR